MSWRVVIVTRIPPVLLGFDAVVREAGHEVVAFDPAAGKFVFDDAEFTDLSTGTMAYHAVNVRVFGLTAVDQPRVAQVTIDQTARLAQMV